MRNALHSAMQIRPYETADEAAVIALWHECGLVRPWNDPHKDIARKLSHQGELFLVGTLGDVPVATAMAGYDGHRGWVYYLAVATAHRTLSLGRAMMDRVEQLLLARGCPKINLQVRTSNAEVIAFYKHLGYSQDDALSLGRRLISDQT